MRKKDIFSTKEVTHIVVSVLVLCVVFSYPEFLIEPYFFLVSLAVLGVAFMGHELSHKFTAIREGFKSEYRMWPQGLAIAVLLALASGGSFIFAAPGAVYFEGGFFTWRPGKKALTRISMAGITFNIALMWASLLLFFVSGLSILAYMAVINGWLAIFNLLPFGMLDGHKLFRLNRDVWIVLMILAAAGFLLSNF
jgi:Zn-dependent protease